MRVVVRGIDGVRLRSRSPTGAAKDGCISPIGTKKISWGSRPFGLLTSVDDAFRAVGADPQHATAAPGFAAIAELVGNGLCRVHAGIGGRKIPRAAVGEIE